MYVHGIHRKVSKRRLEFGAYIPSEVGRRKKRALGKDKRALREVDGRCDSFVKMSCVEDFVS